MTIFLFNMLKKVSKLLFWNTCFIIFYCFQLAILPKTLPKAQWTASDFSMIFTELQEHNKRSIKTVQKAFLIINSAIH